MLVIICVSHNSPAPVLYTRTLPELRRGPLEATPGSNNISPWPETHDDAIVFLLDARDDFEAELLRDWVESRKPESAVLPGHSFVPLHRDAAKDLPPAATRQDAAWMQPLRVAWLPSPHAGRTRSLQDLFHGRISILVTQLHREQRCEAVVIEEYESTRVSAHFSQSIERDLAQDVENLTRGPIVIVRKRNLFPNSAGN